MLAGWRSNSGRPPVFSRRRGSLGGGSILGAEVAGSASLTPSSRAGLPAGADEAPEKPTFAKGHTRSIEAGDLPSARRDGFPNRLERRFPTGLVRWGTMPVGNRRTTWGAAWSSWKRRNYLQPRGRPAEVPQVAMKQHFGPLPARRQEVRGPRRGRKVVGGAYSLRAWQIPWKFPRVP